MILGKQCLCCKHCSECKELKEIIAEIGFDIYLYVKNPQESVNQYDLLESQGFVLKNNHNFTNDFLKKIETNELKCQRCKTILQHISNSLKNQSIDKNEIFVICDCCVNKGTNYGVKCRHCHKIYNKLVTDEELQDDVTNVPVESWVTKIRHLLNSKRETRRFLASHKINKDVYSRQSLPHHHITKSEQKSIADILQSIKDATNVKIDSHKIDHDLAHVPQTMLPQQVGPKEIRKSITDVLKKVPEEAFQYVFPKLKADTKDLTEYVSSRELIKEIQDKINLLREKKSDVYEKKDIKLTKKIESAEIKPNLEKESKIDKSKTKQEKPKKLYQTKKENVVEVDKSKKQSNQVKDTSIKKKEKIPENLQPLPKEKKITQKSTQLVEKDSLTKAIEEAKKNKSKAIKETEKSTKSPPLPKSLNLSQVKIRKGSMDDENIGMIKTKQRPEPEKKIPQLPQINILPTIQRRQHEITSEDSDFDEVDKLFLKKKPIEDNEVIIGQKIFKLKMPFVDKIFKNFSKNKEIQPLLFNSTFNENDLLDIRPHEIMDNKISLVMKHKRSPSVKPATTTALGQSGIAANNDNFRGQYKESEKKFNFAPTESINFSRVKIRNASVDEEHIKMIKIKQSLILEPGKTLKHLADLNILQQPLQRHQTNYISEDSELEIAVDQLLQKNRLTESCDVVVSEKVLKHKPPFVKTLKTNKEVEPLFFETTFNENNSGVIKLEVNNQNFSSISRIKNPATLKESEQEAKGSVRYALSNRSFIDKGWTMLPTEKIVRKMNVYRMRPSHPEFDWFEHNKSKKHMHYDSGEALAEFQEDGRGRLYYRNGRLALDYYNAEEMNAGQRYVVYSNGEPDEKGRSRPVTVLATFDYLGNGIVLDHTGKVRLKYNQTEGVVLDREIGPVSHWKWHELNDPPVLQKVMIDTQMAVKDPEILKLGGIGGNTPRIDNEEMLAIEFDNFIKEKSKKLSQKFKPFQIKMKALKINENFSLKVLDQASVYLLFREGTTNIKLNLGMILDHKEIVDTDTAELGEVTCNLERLPARTDSLAMLQRSVAHAQRVEKLRVDHERRIKVSEEIPSVDRITAAISRPLKSPVRKLPEPKCYCNVVKPPTCS